MTTEPTEATALERPAVIPHCNECNEALDVARATLAAARRLALVAENAIANGDIHRARVALRDPQNDVLASTKSDIGRTHVSEG